MFIPDFVFLMLDDEDDVGADVYPWPRQPMVHLVGSFPYFGDHLSLEGRENKKTHIYTKPDQQTKIEQNTRKKVVRSSDGKR